MEEKRPKRTYLRFIVIGTDEDLAKFEDVADAKNLTREDLILILKTIKLNPSVFG